MSLRGLFPTLNNTGRPFSSSKLLFIPFFVDNPHLNLVLYLFSKEERETSSPLIFGSNDDKAKEMPGSNFVDAAQKIPKQL